MGPEEIWLRDCFTGWGELGNVIALSQGLPPGYLRELPVWLSVPLASCEENALELACTQGPSEVVQEQGSGKEGRDQESVPPQSQWAVM